MKLTAVAVTALTCTLSSIVSAEVMQLTPKTWPGETAGKTVFIKFFAPWCGHCKSMAADFEKLADEWADNKVGLVAEVDCTDNDSEQLCQDFDIQGFPSIKYGDPTMLEDYDGPRTYEGMAEFCNENLKPMCSPGNIDLCDDEDKAVIGALMAKSAAELDSTYEEVTNKLQAEEDKMEQEIEKLQTQYEDLMKEHEKVTTELKASANLSLIKAVLAEKVALNEEL